MIETKRSIVNEDSVKPFKTPAQKRQRLIAVVVVLIIVGITAGAYFLLAPREKSYNLQNFQSTTVQRGDLVQSTQASGSVEIPALFNLVSPETGEAARLFVTEGEFVEKGQILASLDAPDLDDQLDDLESELVTAKRNFDKTQQQNLITISRLEREIENIVDDITDASDERDRAAELAQIGPSETGDDVQQQQNLFTLARMEREIETIEDDIADASDERDRFAALVEINGARQSELDQAEETLEELMELKSEKVTLLEEEGQLQAVGYQDDLEAAEERLSELLDSLSENRIQLVEERRLQALDMDIRSDEIQRTETTISRLQDRIGSVVIQSPMSGDLIKMESSLAVPGSAITANQWLFTILDSSSAVVDLDVGEQYKGSLQTGQTVELTISNIETTGTIESIGKEAELSGDGLGATVVVRVLPDPSAGKLIKGSSVVAELSLGVREDTLLLPRGPYLTTGSQRFLYKISGSSAERVEVAFGEIQGNVVEVLRGVKEGDEIIISGYQNFIEYSKIKLEKGE